MGEYFSAFVSGTREYASYLFQQIAHPAWNNYFWWLTGISLFFFTLELLRPWRKDQPKFRKDFWLDAFYMYFNYFLFSLIVFAGLQKAGVAIFNDFIGLLGMKNMVALHISEMPAWAQMLILFVVADFIQWCTHVLLHRIPRLWEFHKVHHSVEQMGFAAHLRYHWMENVVYKLTQFIPLSMIGFDVADMFAVYMFTTVVGHYNHSNITVDGRITGAIAGLLAGLAIATGAFEINLVQQGNGFGFWGIIAGCTAAGAVLLGPIMKFVFNSPEMHIWHHVHDLPASHRFGINYGITLSVWDWLFRTAWCPHSGRDIKLGFPGIADFPKNFLGHLAQGFRKKN